MVIYLDRSLPNGLKRHSHRFHPSEARLRNRVPSEVQRTKEGPPSHKAKADAQFCTRLRRTKLADTALHQAGFSALCCYQQNESRSTRHFSPFVLVKSQNEYSLCGTIPLSRIAPLDGGRYPLPAFPLEAGGVRTFLCRFYTRLRRTKLAATIRRISAEEYSENLFFVN